jgi:hypothetical protein
VSKWSDLRYRGRHLAVYNDALQPLLVALVERGSELEAADEPWFSSLLSRWRTQSEIRDLGMTLDEQWTPAQRTIVLRLLADADANDAPRTVSDVRDAIVALITEHLPDDPPGGTWYVAVEDGRWIVLPHRA